MERLIKLIIIIIIIEVFENQLFSINLINVNLHFVRRYVSFLYGQFYNHIPFKKHGS